MGIPFHAWCATRVCYLNTLMYPLLLDLDYCKGKKHRSVNGIMICFDPDFAILKIKKTFNDWGHALANLEKD